MSKFQFKFKSPNNSSKLKELVPKELQFAPDAIKYSAESWVGQGGSATVYEGYLKGRLVAVKQFSMDNPKLPINHTLLLNEASQLLELDHTNIIKCLGVCLDRGILVLEFARKFIELDEKELSIHSLRQLIDAISMDFPQDLKHEALYQISNGLRYLHMKEVTHGDLKCGNVLVSGKEEGEFIFKLSDIGQAHLNLTTRLTTTQSVYSTKKKTRMGTTSFEAPEVFFDKPKTLKSDIYSVGMIMYELLYPSLSHPWATTFHTGIPETIRAAIENAVKSGKRPPVEETSTYTALMQLCWDQNPEKRPSSNDFNLAIIQIQRDSAGSSNVSTTNLKVAENSPLKSAVASGNTEPSDHPIMNCEASPVVPNSPSRQSYEVLDSPVFLQSHEQDYSANARLNQQSARTNKSAPPSNKLTKRRLFDGPLIENENMSLELSESDDSLSSFLDATEKTSALMKSRTCDSDDRNDLIKDAMHGSVLHEDENDLEMKWQGYATKYLKIILKPFQIDFMRAFHDKKDAIVVQATGSGKSTCFYLPAVMMPSHHFGILIVPTIALGEDHSRTFKSFGITSVFLNATSSQEDFKQAFDVLPESLRTKILIVQPEIIFGTNSNNGILGRLVQNQHRLNFITIDEGHLVFDWGGFRSDFKEIKKLNSLFICPITVLSATLKPSSLALMRKEILRDPVIIKGTIERPNVTLNILPYRKSSTSEAKENDGDVWYSTAKQIRDIVDGEKTIIYCAFATECEEIRPSLEKLNLKSACYTGKKSNKEKKSIFQQFKDDNIDILVATKAFGLGINMPNIRHIIHIGLPENLAAWMQEYGRAGRDGLPAHAHLLVCDNEDMKKINFWIKNSDSEEQRDSLGNDLAVVWKYYSKAFTGECLRSFQLDYFEELRNLAPIEPISCCSGCRIRVEVPLKPANELYSVLRIFLFFKNRTIMQLCETQILDWTQGNAQNWMWLHFNLEDLQEEETYGCFKSLPESTTKILLKVILRQCLSKNFIELAFDSISNESKTVVKFFSISIDGCNIAKGDAEVPLLPDTKEVANILLRFENSRPDKPEKKRRRKGCDLVSRFTKMMELGEESWCKLDKRDQYELLGFHHDVKKLLYVEDYSKLKCCPDQRPLPNFLWEDNSLAKQSSFPKLPFTLSEGHPDKTKFIMQRSRCNGVKVCQGETERTGQCCTYATSNRVNENKCRKHPHAPLKQSGPCDGYFMYVRPECEEDKRRWLAFFTQDTEENYTHSHPMPMKSKIGSKVEQRIDIAVQNDPTLTAAEISKGIGTGCNLSSMTLVATDINKVRNAVNKSRKKVYSTYSASYILEHFDDVVKNRVDEADLKEMEDPELGKRILHASSPYCRLTRFEESGNFCYLATPQMLEVLNEARFIEADVTFPQTTAFPYVLNMASFNFETLKYQTVARVLMTKLTIAAYKVAFTTVLQLTTNIHPEFELGKDVRGWLLDFSSPQRDGLAASLGDQASSVIRGCLVHYKRGVKKVADKVNRNEESKSLFKKIAYAIPDLEEKEDVTFAFEILCSEANIEDEPTYDFLKNVIKVEVTEIESINTASWTAASEWVKWWSKPKITKMFTKSFTEMSDSDWNICPKTTNVVESQNKQGSTNTNAFLSVLDMFYRTDRKNCYETFAAREGYATGTSLEKRQEQNQRRILAQKRKRFDCGEQSSEDEHETKKTRKIPAAPKKNSARGKGLSKTTTKKMAAPDKGKGKRTPNQRVKTQNGKKPSVIDGAKRGKKIFKKSEDACTEKKDGAKRTIRNKSKKGRKATIHTDENVTSDDQSEIEEGPSKAPTENENNDVSKKNQAVFRDENQLTSEEEEEDFIGKTVLVYTKISTSQIQTRHSKKEWYKCTVVSKNAAGAYVAQVENQKDATITIPDMYDETTVKMNFVD